MGIGGNSSIGVYLYLPNATPKPSKYFFLKDRGERHRNRAKPKQINVSKRTIIHCDKMKTILLGGVRGKNLWEKIIYPFE